MTRTRQQGLTLIGVLVALFILVSGVVVVAQLVARTRHVVGLSREQFVATGLAREGLELIQAKRDNNWLAREDAARTGVGSGPASWMDELCLPGETLVTHVIDREASGGLVIMDSTAAPLYITPAGRYTHLSSGATLSAYARVVEIDCTQFESLDRVTVPAVVTVTSRVTWIQGGKARQVALTDKLYDWRV